MVRASIDGGRTWPRSLRVTQGAFAYSCLALVPQRGQLGLLWETSMDPSVCVGEIVGGMRARYTVLKNAGGGKI